MAGIRRRSRPRKRSFNLRRLRYVLVREAAFRIFYPNGTTHPNAVHYKHQFVITPTDKVVAHASTLLALHPERRYWPPSLR